ncbi:putative cyclin-A3-1 isoform X1 [Quercus robur]|uniref:putative cyclin-A3-1 isoform X1 n=1 Tax=Quercus robur TaxID=38942 RepID=UPI0021631450|nr:putative cyclin-A3-1 isoform X1 [Quercus robur]
MAEQENCVRITRAAKKRALSAASGSPNKKRVVLGELPNLSNVVVPVNNKPVTKTKPKAKKALTTTLIRTTKGSPTKVEIDDSCDDPQLCGAYASDIDDYLHKMEMETKRRPVPNYLEKVQKEVTANMRGVLVDWLVEVAEEYKLLPDTLYLAISYIDRFLSLNVVHKQKLQLLGVSSMLIASKYEEITAPDVGDFCYITDNTYPKEEVVKMEADILKSLKFEMGNPTVKTFLRRFTSVAQTNNKSPNLQLEFLGYYLGELSLLDYNCVKFLPSLVAASVIFLAKFIIQPMIHPWCATLQQYSGYKPADLKDCVLIIHDLYVSRKGGSLQAIREKYKQHKFKYVASMPSPPEIPASYFEDLKE